MVQEDGKILAGGALPVSAGSRAISSPGSTPPTGLADSFNANANIVVSAIALQTDGKILVGGYFSGIGGQLRIRIARLDAMTGLADSFNPNPTVFLNSIAVQADGKILVGGDFTGLGETRKRIARLESDGRLDRTLDLGGCYVVIPPRCSQTARSYRWQLYLHFGCVAQQHRAT